LANEQNGAINVLQTAIKTVFRVGEDSQSRNFLNQPIDFLGCIGMMNAKQDDVADPNAANHRARYGDTTG
jgi:hypothetical protein